MNGDCEKFPGIVQLNVGGVQFSTSLETLQGSRFGGDVANGGSMLAAMFSGRMPARRDGEGRFFIDRDGRYFHHILNYLRDGKFPVSLSASERAELEREASFFGLEPLASHLRADLSDGTIGSVTGLDGFSLAVNGNDGSSVNQCRRVLSAAQATDRVLNKCLEDWPEFPQLVQGIIDRLLAVGGVAAGELDDDETLSPGGQHSHGVALDEAAAQSLQASTLAAIQLELAHVDSHSKVWRWSDRKTGVNSVLRAKLLCTHLMRLGYRAQIVPLLDRKEVSAYVLQLELPLPSH